jgi:transglutaminase-like putative cysteine protease
MKKVFVFFALLVSASVFAEDPKYPVSEISEALRKDMYAVIRNEEIRYDVKDLKSVTYVSKKVITILNSQAAEYSRLSFPYSKDTKIQNLKITVYDAFGKVIKKVKPSEIRDQSYVDGFSLYRDSRLKYIDLSQTILPFTIEYEIEYDMGLYQFQDFYLWHDDEIAAEKIEYTITYPKNQRPRYRLFRMKEPHFELLADNKELMSWKFEDVRPEKFEPMSPGMWRVVPNAMIGPVAFDLYGYAGRMDSWESLGKWQVLLNQGRDVLPDATQQKVKQLISGKTTVEEKAKVLYEFVQGRTRYVSIQKGIGGSQPFPATMVDEVGYGDCKALSNYMVSLLKTAGINGYYTQVFAGDNNIDFPTDFVADNFNHIIVSIPNGKDTLWLECTNQQMPFGYLGEFTADRKALMITENGGALVNTQRYPEHINTQTRTADVKIEMTGDAKAKVTTTYAGLQFDNGNFLGATADDQKRWLRNSIAIPAFDLNKYDITVTKAKIPTAVVNVDLTMTRFASVSGKRLFITPNLMNRSKFIPEKTEKRRNAIVLASGWIDYDTIRYQLPEGIYPEFLPEPVTIKSKFGQYDAKFEMRENELIYVRVMRKNKGEYPAESYQELIDFYKNINKADNTKLVFLNKT